MMLQNDFFVEQLLRKAGHQDDEDIQTHIDSVRPILFDWVMTNIISRLPDEDAILQFKELFEKSEDPEKIMDFLKKHIEDVDGYIDELYLEFEKMYLENFQDFLNENS